MLYTVDTIMQSINNKSLIMQYGVMDNSSIVLLGKYPITKVI